MPEIRYTLDEWLALYDKAADRERMRWTSELTSAHFVMYRTIRYVREDLEALARNPGLHK